MNRLPLYKRIFLFLDATPYMISKELSSADSGSYSIRRFASVITLIAELGFIAQFPTYSRNGILAVIAYHIVTNVFFINDIEKLTNNYFSNYNKPAFAFYILFFIVGLFLMGFYLWER